MTGTNILEFVEFAKKSHPKKCIKVPYPKYQELNARVGLRFHKIQLEPDFNNKNYLHTLFTMNTWKENQKKNQIIL